jgi:cardiolipin synthase
MLPISFTDMNKFESVSQSEAVIDEPAIEPQFVTVAGQELQIFAGAPGLIASLVQDIRLAQERVWIECYIFLEDEAGQAVSAALKDRARAGLDVRVLYDAIGSNSTSSDFFRDMEQAGVRVFAYHTIWEAILRNPIVKTLEYINCRDHRKLMIIDDRVAYFGGMNIVHQVDDGSAQENKLPASAVWRDIHIRLEGDQAGLVADSFKRSWNRAHWRRSIVGGATSVVMRSDSAHGSRRMHWLSFKRKTAGADAFSTAAESIRFFDAGPAFKRGQVVSVFRGLMRGARSDVFMSMAYFIPAGRVLRSLVKARRRGVRVRAVVPGNSDVKLVQWATRHIYGRLLRCGIELHERQRRMLHSKVMIVDSEWTMIGSCNLDPRSLWINQEFFALIRSKVLAQKLIEICTQDIAHSTRVTLDSLQTRTWWQRLLDRTAYALRWWL